MKQNSKVYLFTNFNLPIKPNTYEKNDLSINNVFNIQTSHSRIEPLMDFSDYFQKKLSKEEFQLFTEINNEIINDILCIAPYEFFEESNQEHTIRHFAITNNLILHELNTSSMKLVNLNISFASLPKVYYNSEQLVLTDSKSTFIVIDKNNPPYFVTSYPDIHKWCTFLDNTYVLFNNKKYSVYSCTNNNIFELSPNITDYEEIQLNSEFGHIEDIFEFENYILIFQQYRISKLTKTNSIHKISTTNFLTSQIYGKTIAKINDYVVFLSSSGLYIFDGNDTKQIFAEITKDIAYGNFEAVVFNNKYYLKSEFYISGAKENVLFELDIEKNICSIFKFDSNIENLRVIKNSNDYLLCLTLVKDNQFKVVCLNNSKTNSLTKQITFNKIAFDTNNNKKLKSIQVLGSGEFYVSVSSENNECNFHSFGHLSANNIGLQGQFFEFSITSDKAFIIDAISFEIENIEDSLWLTK